MNQLMGRRLVRRLLGALNAVVLMLLTAQAGADETRLSPFIARLVGQEQLLHVWTQGVVGLGDGHDKLVTIDVDPASALRGKVVHVLSVGARGQARHAGFTDDRRYLWATTLDDSRIYIFDVASDPRRPSLHRVIDDFSAVSGGVLGPNAPYALPGRMLVSGLSNAEDGSGRTALVEFSNAGEHIATHWMPTDAELRGADRSGEFADGHGHEVAALPARGVLLSSSFTGRDNYLTPLLEVLGDAQAMRRFGNTVVVWDLHSRQPLQVLDVPGAPTALRCAAGWRGEYCFTATLLGAQLWLIDADEAGEWRAEPVADVGTAGSVPMPVDLSLSADHALLWVNTWNDGTTRLFDVRDPRAPVQLLAQPIGEQLGAVAQSWDGQRLYFSSATLASWDRSHGVPDHLQFVKGYRWTGDALEPTFAIDFLGEQLGHPQQIHLGTVAPVAGPSGDEAGDEAGEVAQVDSAQAH